MPHKHLPHKGGSVTTIRQYRNEDAIAVGKLIADTYSEFNLSFVPPKELGLFLGPFQYANSPDKDHQEAIVKVIQSEMVVVAEDGGRIVGVLRGRSDRLASLFVSGRFHRQGVGRKLVQRFETECFNRNTNAIKVSATLQAVPFYLAMGYKRTTGIRSGGSFEGTGLPVQPMKKWLQE